jgi:hypothetical protein
MLNSIILRFTEVSEPIKLSTDGVTIFVGPNNSGKSLVLREIEQWIVQGNFPQAKIVSDFDIDLPDRDKLLEDVAPLKKRAPPGLSSGQIYVGRYMPNGRLDAATVDLENLNRVIASKNKHWVSTNFWRFFQIRLDGRTRFDLTNDRETGDLLALPQNRSSICSKMMSCAGKFEKSFTMLLACTS